MMGVRALAVWVAAMWFSTAAVAAVSSVSAGHVREVWNPPEVRHVAHATHAHSGGVHHVTRGNHGHGGKAVNHAQSRHVGAAKPVAKKGGGHRLAGSGVRRPLARHDDPHSRKVGSPAHSLAHAEPKPAPAQPAPHQHKPATQTASTHAAQPRSQSIQRPQARPPILR